MKATIVEQKQIGCVTRVVLEHLESGYQIEITPARTGFLIHSSQGLKFRRYDALSFEIEAEMSDGFSPIDPPQRRGR